MTKKAAKKKQTTRKQAPKKAAAKSTRSKEEAPEEPVSQPEEVDPAASEQIQEIPLVEEAPPAVSEGTPKKQGRVSRSTGSLGRQDSQRTRSGSSRRGGGRRGGGARPPVDFEELGRKAWKVFQQEIAEEGLALIDEISARQLAEKSIVVTRAFLEERERRLGTGGKASEEKNDSSPQAEPTPPKEGEAEASSGETP